jgi:hypothetical protein
LKRPDQTIIATTTAAIITVAVIIAVSIVVAVAVAGRATFLPNTPREGARPSTMCHVSPPVRPARRPPTESLCRSEEGIKLLADSFADPQGCLLVGVPSGRFGHRSTNG